jgi:hypothetical protein
VVTAYVVPHVAGATAVRATVAAVAAVVTGSAYEGRIGPGDRSVKECM